MNSRTSSGVLRNVSTNTPPTQLSGLSGATLSAATRVPTIIAITNEIATRRVGTQKPELNAGNWSLSTSQSSATGQPRRSLGADLERLLQGHLRRLLLLVEVPADPLPVGVLPATVLL